MEQNQFLEGINKALSTVLGKTFSVKPSDRLTRDIGLESIDVVDLVFELERHFGVEVDIQALINGIGKVDERRYENLTVQEIITYLANAKK